MKDIRPFIRKIIRGIGKLVIFLGLSLYVLVGGGAAWTLFQAIHTRQQPISALNDIIEKSVRMQTPGTVTQWVRLRPLAETQQIIDVVTPQSGGLEPEVFFEFAQREAKLNHMEDALFWLQYGHYRMRFDSVRCGSEHAQKVFDIAIRAFPMKNIEDYLGAHPQLLKPSIQRVLDFDAKYPAQNDPARICKIADKLGGADRPAAPKEQWEVDRRNLRFATEIFLNGGKPPEKEKDKAAPEKKK
jgi:hypothetical protein